MRSFSQAEGGNQKLLKLLRTQAECIGDVFDVIKTFETSQGIHQKRRSFKFTKRFEYRFEEHKNKKKSRWDVTAVQKYIKGTCKDEPKKDECFKGACFFCGEKGPRFFKCTLRELVDKLRK